MSWLTYLLTYLCCCCSVVTVRQRLKIDRPDQQVAVSGGAVPGINPLSRLPTYRKYFTDFTEASNIEDTADMSKHRLNAI